MLVQPAGSDLHPGPNGRVVDLRGIIRQRNAFPQDVQLDPVASRRNILQEQRSFSAGGEQNVTAAPATEIRHNTTGISLDLDDVEQVAAIELGGIEELIVRPIVEQHHRPPSPISTMGIRNHNVQVPIVVHVGELSSGSTQPAEIFAEFLVFLEAEGSLVQEQVDAVPGEDEKVALPVLIGIAAGGEDHVLDVQAGGGGVQAVKLAGPVIDPGQGLAFDWEKDEVRIQIVVEIIPDDGGHRGPGQIQTKRGSHILEAAIAVVLVDGADGRHGRASGRDRSLAPPKSQQVQVAVIIDIHQPSESGEGGTAAQARRGLPGEVTFAVVLEQDGSFTGSQPEVQVALVIHIGHVAQARGYSILGQHGPRRESALAIVPPDSHSALGTDSCKAQVQIPVPVHVSRRDSGKADGTAAPVPGSRTVRQIFDVGGENEAPHFSGLEALSAAGYPHQGSGSISLPRRILNLRCNSILSGRPS